MKKCKILPLFMAFVLAFSMVPTAMAEDHNGTGTGGVSGAGAGKNFGYNSGTEAVRITVLNY